VIRTFMCLMCVLVCVSANAQSFRTVPINTQSTYSACTVLEMNGDGRPDIVCGAYWYESPTWAPHLFREVNEIRGRFDDYSNLLMDVNSDGHLDIISANYRSESLYWIENPGRTLPDGQFWRRHLVEKPGPMETARLFEVDADGQLDVLPNGTKFAAWWSVQSGSSPVWNRLPLPDELAGHGIGFGDINGDGRVDIIGPRGWAEAPLDRCRERWQFHPEFTLWQDASIPIQVLDVDRDGDADLVWGRGHQVGLYWLEQSRNDRGERSWQSHVIDTGLSQAHSVELADLNVDGVPEIITGSRYMGHDGKDQGEYNPRTVCSYEFLPERHTWKKTVISQRPDVGFDLDPEIADLDGDGDPDVLCSGRSGLFLLENLHSNGSNAAPDLAPFEISADSYDHRNIMSVRRDEDSAVPVETAFDLGLRRNHILQGMSLAMGSLPGPEVRVPLDVQIHTEEDAGSYVRRRISFAAEPGDRVPAWLLMPKNRRAPGAAVLCLHQTTGIGKGEPAGLGGLPNLHYGHELANAGFVCLIPDYPSFGDYTYDFKTQGSHYASGSMKAIWNNVRAVDLLQTLPEVHPDRIGVIGHSLGGHNSLFTAAFDQRIRAVVTSCGFTAFHDYYKGDLRGWTSDRYMPRIQAMYGNNPDQVPFDFQEVLTAIAPRAVFINAPQGDDNFEVSGVKTVVQEVRQAYAIYEQPAKLVAHYPDCAHDFPTEVRLAAYDWLKEILEHSN
jgi:dienelactone hydrolase